MGFQHHGRQTVSSNFSGEQKVLNFFHKFKNKKKNVWLENEPASSQDWDSSMEPGGSRALSWTKMKRSVVTVQRNPVTHLIDIIYFSLNFCISLLSSSRPGINWNFKSRKSQGMGEVEGSRCAEILSCWAACLEASSPPLTWLPLTDSNARARARIQLFYKLWCGDVLHAQFPLSFSLSGTYIDSWGGTNYSSSPVYKCNR